MICLRRVKCLLGFVMAMMSVVWASGDHPGVWLQQSQTQMCTSIQQRRAVLSGADCQPRDTVIKLPLPSVSSALYRQTSETTDGGNGSTRNSCCHVAVIPDRVVVKRCGGHCFPNRYHSCVATSVRPVYVSVVLLSDSTAAANTGNRGHQVEPDCAVATVEEHLSCGCGCPLLMMANTDEAQGTEQNEAICGRSSLGVVKLYRSDECRCECGNVQEKANCALRNQHWDEEVCACLCVPRTHFTPCPTGYVFDFRPDVCSCAQHAADAGLLNQLAPIIIVAGIIITAITLAHCKLTHTGLFRQKPPQPVRLSRNQSTAGFSSRIRWRLVPQQVDSDQHLNTTVSSTATSPAHSPIPEANSTRTRWG